MGIALARALRLVDRRGTWLPSTYNGVAFIGSGGKTSAIAELSRSSRGPVLIAAATHMGNWQLHIAANHLIATAPADLEALSATQSTLVTGPATADNKFAGIDLPVLEQLREYAIAHQMPLLLECDGSRQKQIKAWATHEPVLPEGIGHLVVVLGVGALGLPLNEAHVHRAGLFALRTGLSSEAAITAAAAATNIRHDYPKWVRPFTSMKSSLLLTHIASSVEHIAAKQISLELADLFERAVVAGTDRGQADQRLEPIATVILAAGAAKRFGAPKQLAMWQGESLVHHAAKVALSAGFLPVIVVLGAHATEVRAAIDDLPLHTVHNKDWRDGVSTSIRTGLMALPQNTGGVIFMLADQPGVSPELLRALVDRHQREDPSITLPMHASGRRGNPALFDRDLFGQLALLQGDTGGRALFSQHSLTYVPWVDEGVFADIDTPEDLLRLQRYE